MNYVSFSLYGADPKYCVGAVKNAAKVPEAYPGFKAVFALEDTVPRLVIRELRARGALCFAGSTRWMKNQKVWRLLAFDLKDAEVVLFRDADSRISKREIAAVNEWSASGVGAHVMRDFPKHTDPLMGGMWGLRKSKFTKLNMGRVWNQYCSDYADWDHPSDQRFLRRAVWPLVKNDILQHDEFTGCEDARQFPVPFDPAEGFVGEIFLADDTGVQEHKNERGVAPYGPK